MAAVWETHAAGSIGRIGSPAQWYGRTCYVGKDVNAGITVGVKINRLQLTPGKSEAAPRVRIPALSNGQCNGPEVRDGKVRFDSRSKKIILLLNVQLTLACAQCL